MAVYLIHHPLQDRSPGPILASFYLWAPVLPSCLFLPLIWQQAALSVRRARAPPALHIPAPAPVSYVLALEYMVSYLLQSSEGYFML